MQKVTARFFKSGPEDWHLKKATEKEHFALVRSVTEAIQESGLVARLLRNNFDKFTHLLGPDIDMQTAPHVRISRPGQSSDFVAWHRDTFYGNSPWEMNVWFPIFELKKGAGLMIVAGSHRMPSREIETVDQDYGLEQAVKKGSVINRLGYPHTPKRDRVIATLKPSQVAVVRPRVGQAVIFFGCSAHKAANESSSTRVTVDLRVKNTHAPTNTKPGYYVPLHRGVLAETVAKFEG